MISVDGRDVWIHDIVTVQRDANGEPSVLSGFMLDITRRKQAEQKLRASESLMRTMADSLPVSITYIDSDRCYQFNNAACERWVGRAAGVRPRIR